MNKIRRIDDLGRVVIPKEIRRILGISASEGDLLEINVNSITGQVIIEKYKVESTKRCNWCGGYVDDLVAEEGSEEGDFYHPDCWKKARKQK